MILKIELTDEEYAGLLLIAEAEIRTPARQMQRFLQEALGTAPVQALPVEEQMESSSNAQPTAQ